MRIGFDISQTGNGKAGCGYLAHSLIRAMERLRMEHQFLLYPAVGDTFWDPDCRSSTYRPESPQMRRRPAPRDFSESLAFWVHPDADFEERLGSPDLVHSNNFFAPRGLTRARLVWTLYDLDFVVHPEWNEEANRTSCFHGAFGAAQRADLILAISEFSRRQFLEIFPHYPADRIAVIPLASRFTAPPASARRPVASLPPGSYWLSVGTLQPRKNVARLARAWMRLREKDPATPRLVLAGGDGWLMDEIRRSGPRTAW